MERPEKDTEILVVPPEDALSVAEAHHNWLINLPEEEREKYFVGFTRMMFGDFDDTDPPSPLQEPNE